MQFWLSLAPDITFRTTAAAIGMSEDQARAMHSVSAIDPRYQQVRVTMENASIKLSRMTPAGRA